MFATRINRRGSRWAYAASFVVHAIVIGVLAWKPEAQVLTPSSSLRGLGGNAGGAISLVAPGASVTYSAKAVEQELRKSELELRRRKAKKKAEPKPPQQAAQTDRPLRPGMPGYILGSLMSGIASNHDVRIALPVVAPDPPIVRHKLPEWIRGKVVVEVTISETGDVTEAVVLETVGYGLEQIVVDTLRTWRWKPATVDGIKVASKQDIHFNFPS